MKTALRILLVLLGLGYPVLVYFGLHWFEPRVVAVFLAAALMLRLVLGPRRQQAVSMGKTLSFPLAMLAFAYALTFIFNEGVFFLFVPALFSAALLVSFGRTLFVPPSMVETFARGIRSDLSDEHVTYCRRVTLVWTIFFLLNGSLALALALDGDLEAWTLYNGFLAYILMGALFAGEFLYRRHRFPQLRKPATVQRPERLHRSSGDGWLELRLRVPEDLCYFDGHFDDFPVVAGVVQLEWIHELAAELLGAPPTIARMEQIKFHQLLQPGQAFSARLDHDRERSRIAYVLHDGEARFASGRMVLKR
jgi:uncharacterized membrane protein